MFSSAFNKFLSSNLLGIWCQWSRGLRRRSAVAHLLRWCFRIPLGGMDVCLLWLLCVARERSLRRADHSSRGTLPTVVPPSVWSSNLTNEKAIAALGLRAKKNLLGSTSFLAKISARGSYKIEVPPADTSSQIVIQSSYARRSQM